MKTLGFLEDVLKATSSGLNMSEELILGSIKDHECKKQE
jgi:hypothetical protein